MVTTWLLCAILCSCVGVNNDDFQDILRDLFTEETLNNNPLWLETYWYIPLGIIIVVIIVVVLLILTILIILITYRRKSKR